jgi:molybdopterin synthase catalytic subunit/molybdopterin converting factor small subunit
MRVRLKVFAALRERTGASEHVLELPDGARAADVWAALPALGEPVSSVLYARNMEYVEPEAPLADGDEIALIPPVSGGSFRLTADPVDVGAVIADVADERAGAIATFLGTTRATSRGRNVLHLEYEAYEGMAEQEMARIAAALLARYELCRVAITHRVGRVDIGEVSVAIAVSAPHRADAIAAVGDAIDTLKKTVPLWKKEVYEGGEQWIGRGS